MILTYSTKRNSYIYSRTVCQNFRKIRVRKFYINGLLACVLRLNGSWKPICIEDSKLVFQNDKLKFRRYPLRKEFLKTIDVTTSIKIEYV